MKQSKPATLDEPVSEEASAPPSCGWFELPDLFTGGPSERCLSGKPATFVNCGFDEPVCEDHKCRCEQHPQVVLPQGLFTAIARASCGEDDDSTTQWFPANVPPPDDRDVLAYSSIDGKYHVACFVGDRWSGTTTPWRIEWWMYLPSAPSKESERAP